ncbi:MAG: HAD-IC family P-type ATPase, partial [Anaerolineae bacterium]|nr:HAD-IC family P-type ATPase [Anaerolineae bacterium]
MSKELVDGRTITGLSESEAATRRERGQRNVLPFQSGRSYLQILRKNVFTFINTVLFAISLLLVLMGHLGDAVVTAGLVLLNVVVGVAQEGRAKRKLDQLALLTRPKATVIREGQERSIDRSEVVLGDVLVARPGDQFVVDGEIIGEGKVEVDESLLTGESERIRKGRGEALYSGTFCVSGIAVYEALKVGADCQINQMTEGARAFRQVKTPLQREVEFVIRILLIAVGVLGALLTVSFLLQGMPIVEGVRAAAVIVALVPQGLFFMTTVSYAMGVVRVAGRGALIQEANAVESTSHVDLLCLDKTGTLTTNRISLRGIVTLDEAWRTRAGELESILGVYAFSSRSGDRTTEALRLALRGEAHAVSDEVPFSSDYKWSALAFVDAGLPGVYVLGAPEVMAARVEGGRELGSQIDALTGEGQRVLLFARSPARVALREATGEPRLPSGLVPLCLLSFQEELRTEAEMTLGHFRELGVGVKIISGDNPQTVASMARQVGLDTGSATVSGLEVGSMSDERLGELAEETTVFGRITPQQKQRLIGLFRQQGHYVGMIGDGVNDVLSLKQADLGVAMESGSQAARSVADIVLLGDSFGALPIALREGQRIVRGMEDVVRLLLTRTLYVMFLIVATQIVGVAFPVTPKHNSILALLTVGIPIFALAAWARPGAAPRSVIRSASRFIWPAAITVSMVALATYLFYLARTGDVGLARSALTTVTVFCGLFLILFVEPPTQFWVAGDELSGDWRPSALALGMLVIYGCVLAIEPLRTFFELSLLPILDYLALGAVAVGWAF